MRRVSKSEASATAAVSVVGGRHAYREVTAGGVQRQLVLDGLNMTVPAGNIYALLGASGCGKTTLLRAMVGQHRLDSGSMLVFGRRPGDPNSGIPGPAIGYMPQELALHEKLTIEETLRFYGMVTGMPVEDIKRKTAQAVDTLDLPCSSRVVKSLSGGQKRRLSFAIALLNTPPLLILDEPTVGVDPLLRNRIWCNLIELTSTGKTTVLVTTHYVHEAQDADMIGVIRYGKMLVEENPRALMNRLSTSDLEDAIFLMCHNQEERRNNQQISDVIISNVGYSPAQSITTSRNFDILKSNSFLVFRALLWKDTTQLRRSFIALFLLFLYTLCLSVITMASYKGFPEGRSVGVVNDEADCSNWTPGPLNCSWPNRFSCRFMESMRERHLNVMSFSDVESAEEAVRKGATWGVLHFHPNYSSALAARMQENLRFIENTTVDWSTVVARLDMSDAVVSQMLVRRLSEITRNVMDEAEDCVPDNVSPNEVLKIQEPVHGQKEPGYGEDQYPTMVLSPVYFFASMLALTVIMPERLEKSMERSQTTGVRRSGVLLSKITTCAPILILKNFLSLIFLFVVLKVPCLGPFGLVVLFQVLFNFTSFFLGVIFSLITDSYALAIMLVQTSFLCFLTYTGTMWPVEGMHWTLALFVDVSPMSAPAFALQGILRRGWGFQHPVVRYGVLMSVIWVGLLVGVLCLWTLLSERGRPFYRLAHKLLKSKA